MKELRKSLGHDVQKAQGRESREGREREKKKKKMLLFK